MNPEGVILFCKSDVPYLSFPRRSVGTRYNDLYPFVSSVCIPTQERGNEIKLKSVAFLDWWFHNDLYPFVSPICIPTQERGNEIFSFSLLEITIIMSPRWVLDCLWYFFYNNVIPSGFPFSLFMITLIIISSSTN